MMISAICHESMVRRDSLRIYGLGYSQCGRYIRSSFQNPLCKEGTAKWGEILCLKSQSKILSHYVTAPLQRSSLKPSFLRLSGGSSGIILRTIFHLRIRSNSRNEEDRSNGIEMNHPMNGICFSSEKQDIHSSMLRSGNLSRRTGCIIGSVWLSHHFSRKILVLIGVWEKSGSENTSSTMMKL